MTLIAPPFLHNCWSDVLGIGNSSESIPNKVNCCPSVLVACFSFAFIYYPSSHCAVSHRSDEGEQMCPEAIVGVLPPFYRYVHFNHVLNDFIVNKPQLTKSLLFLFEKIICIKMRIKHFVLHCPGCNQSFVFFFFRT